MLMLENETGVRDFPDARLFSRWKELGDYFGFAVSAVHSIVLPVMMNPWPLQAFWPFSAFAVLQALWPLQALAPSHFLAPSALAVVTMAPAANRAAAVAANIALLDIVTSLFCFVMRNGSSIAAVAQLSQHRGKPLSSEIT
jgi:hypothetical protein